jgi:hypothetical protein
VTSTDRSARHAEPRSRAARRRSRIALGRGLGAVKLRFGGRYEERFVVGALL